MTSLLVKNHIRFCLRCLKVLPPPYQAEESSRSSVAFFVISALALLPSGPDSDAICALDEHVSVEEKNKLADWFYLLQNRKGGFSGDTSVQKSVRDDDENPNDLPLRTSHVVSCFVSLLALVHLGDDLSRVNRKGISSFLRSCQAQDGSFMPYPQTSYWREEGDPRFVYSAFAVCVILDDWSGVDIDRAIDYLFSLRRFEGGFAHAPLGEAHSAATYCAISALSLANRLDSISPAHREDLLRWLYQNQVLYEEDWSPSKMNPTPTETELQKGETVKPFGFRGRTNKEPDACYSFWASAALHILDPEEGIPSPESDREFLILCQSPIIGGIARCPGNPPDVFHTYLSLAALSLNKISNLRPLDPALNAPLDLRNHLPSTKVP